MQYVVPGIPAADGRMSGPPQRGGRSGRMRGGSRESILRHPLEYSLDPVMETRDRPRARKAWPAAFLAISALVLFLVDSLTIAKVGDLRGYVSAVYPGTRIQSAACREVGVTLAGGKIVLVTVTDGAAINCQLGRSILIRHLRTRVLGLSSYETLQASGARL